MTRRIQALGVVVGACVALLVATAQPALAQNGLFRHLDQHFPSLSGYYTTVQIVSLLATMALCRIKTVEQLQYHPPGELGKLLGLDRVPEVRCLRNKLAALSEDQAPEKWAAQLSRDWLEADPDLAGALYVDGHVRLPARQARLARILALIVEFLLRRVGDGDRLLVRIEPHIQGPRRLVHG